MRMSDIMKELEAAMEKGDCKVKITIKGKAGQAGTLAEALDGFLKDELKARAKYPEKTQYEIHVVQRTFYRTVKGSRAAKDAEQAEGKG